MKDYTQDFKSHMASFGLFPDDVIGDSRLHKFGKNNHGWYILFQEQDGAGGAFGSWSKGIEKETWSSFTKGENADPERMAKIMAKIEESKLQHDIAKKERAKNAAFEAVKLWSDGEPVNDDHPYLVKKQITGKGLKLEKGTTNLMVPMYASGMKLIGIQRIMEDGTKRFIYGAAKKGSCSVIKGEFNDRLYIAEGFATAMTIYMATKRTVFVAFDSGNLYHVAKQIKAKTNVPVIVCGDDDVFTVLEDGSPYNSGRISALKCEKELCCIAIFPSFDSGNVLGTDFNDLMVAHGIGRVEEIASNPWDDRGVKIKRSVKQWARAAIGKFTATDIDRELGIIAIEDKKSRDEAIKELLGDGTLERDDVRNGVYRARDCQVNVIDLRKVEKTIGIAFWIPFGLGEIVSMSPRNICMIAGESNSGKTSMALEMLRENLSLYRNDKETKFYYFTSEMSAQELEKTVLRFGSLDDFEGCTFIDRQFEPFDLIKNDKGMQDGIVFIDFLETRGGDYSKTVSEVQRIYESMNKGIVVLLVQKMPGRDHAKGGVGMMEKPRFILNLEKRFKSDSGTVCIANISKCKSVFDGEINPDGKSLYYIVNGRGLSQLTDWSMINDKAKEETDAVLKNHLGVREYEGPTIDMDTVQSIRR